jgi:hypothetical protein
LVLRSGCLSVCFCAFSCALQPAFPSILSVLSGLHRRITLARSEPERYIAAYQRPTLCAGTPANPSSHLSKCGGFENHRIVHPSYLLATQTRAGLLCRLGFKTKMGVRSSVMSWHLPQLVGYSVHLQIQIANQRGDDGCPGARSQKPSAPGAARLTRQVITCAEVNRETLAPSR